MAKPEPPHGFADLITPITPERASTLISQQVRQAIAEGRLKPGDKLPSERELADRFAVSRVTVRDALRSLEASGLVQVRVGATGGAFVTAPTGQLLADNLSNLLMMSLVDPEEIAEARVIIELGTVSLAIQRATEEDLEALRDVCRRSDEALKAGNYETSLSAEFHVRLAEAAHNRAIDVLTNSFRGPFSLHALRAREPTEASHKASVKDHKDVLAALEKRDEEGARRAMRRHLTRGATPRRSSPSRPIRTDRT